MTNGVPNSENMKDENGNQDNSDKSGGEERLESLLSTIPLDYYIPS